jgi:hypothetical protein
LLSGSILEALKVAAMRPAVKSASYHGMGNERILRALIDAGLAVNCLDGSERFMAPQQFWREEGEPKIPDLRPRELKKVKYFIEGLDGGDLLIFEKPNGVFARKSMERLLGAMLPEPLVFFIIAADLSAERLPRNFAWRFYPEYAVGELTALLYYRDGRNVGRDRFQALAASD